MRISLFHYVGIVACFITSPLFAVNQNAPSVKIGTYPQEISHVYDEVDGLPSNHVLSIAVSPDGTVYAGTVNGNAVFRNGKWIPVSEEIPFVNMRIDFSSDPALSNLLGEDQQINAVAYDSQKSIAVAAEAGLFLKKEDKEWTALYPHDEKGRSWAPRNVKGVTFDKQDRLWFAGPQGVGCYSTKWTLYTGKEGLPYNDFTCVAPGEPGVVWFGTQIGAIRFDGKNWDYRQGPRWLPDDRINDIAVASDGSAWFATPAGVGWIERRSMTLAEKADFYENEIENHIKRTEFGYLSEVRLQQPGDKSAILYSDSDNDGLWTSMYGAGACFAYAVTRDENAKKRAQEAFEALRFLSVVTQGGEVEQQPGFVARTVVPTSEPNPNERSSYTLEGMKRTRDSGDARWKVYYPRWPLSQDGNFWYKTDTSSDELDGHFFFYALYYDLVADSPQEKERVREVVRSITDHLIRNDFCLIDHDGTPTRWAVFGPKFLNRDPVWYPERGLNSLSILSYLTVAEFVTGDERYGEYVKQLCEEHAYDINAMVAKIQRGIGSGNQSDDEMAFMSYYNLIKYTKNETLRREMIFSFYNYWILEFPEMNPFFNFTYAACAESFSYTDPWGTYPLRPWDGWLEDSVETLQGFPLDRLNWPHQNSHRLDLIALPRQAGINSTDSGRRKRGYRVNDKVLSVQNRHFNHYNTDPWTLDYGGDGRTLASGTVFLLPYYMGLYHGYIK
ncbi:MAG: hypothetical protein C4527_06785 [Candidatus Omnitrophota bacterium]|jgi:hypothetical protein|nr:MAG: hypothetical protein C4527_06785 [Candidatus Omnitrophota bacterium]